MRILILIVVLSTTCQMYAQNLLVKYRTCNPYDNASLLLVPNPVYPPTNALSPNFTTCT